MQRPVGVPPRAYERQLISDTLHKVGGVQTRAAKNLGTTRRILRYKMEKLGLVEPDPTD
ncbi:MAG: helix-turn-helix domain-containing protein [bacterium]